MFTSFLYRLCLAGLGLLMAGNVWALTPSDGDPDISLYIPGSQANDPVYGFMVGGVTVANAICADDANASGTTTTTHIYFHTAGAVTAAVNDNYSGIYCLASLAKLSALGFALATTGTFVPNAPGGGSAGSANEPNAKVKVWISRRRLGASFVALNAVAHNQSLTFLEKPNSAGCTANNGSYSSGGTTFQWNYSCTTVVSKFPTGATGDVTPDAYHGSDNLTPGSSAINPASFDNIKVVAGHIIGIPVTLKLRNALQYAGIQSGSLPSTLTGTGTCVVGDETVTCMPSLSKQQLVSLFTGGVYDWSSVKVKVLANSTLPIPIPGNSISLPALIAAGVTAGVAGIASPADTAVHICRRENGAGQQVAVLANILQYPCLDGDPHRIADTNATFADVVYATSLGAVDSCLKDYNDGTNTYFGTLTNSAPYNDYRQVPASTYPHGNMWALSIQTTERNKTNAANYRFIKIDGATPTGEQAFLGHYPLIGEYTLAWNSGNNNINYTSVAGDITSLQSAIAKSGAQPTTVASRNNSLSLHTWGQAGYIGLSANGFPPPDTWTPSNPISPFVRLSLGKPNACVIPTANLDYVTFELR